MHSYLKQLFFFTPLFLLLQVVKIHLTEISLRATSCTLRPLASAQPAQAETAVALINDTDKIRLGGIDWVLQGLGAIHVPGRCVNSSQQMSH